MDWSMLPLPALRSALLQLRGDDVKSARGVCKQWSEEIKRIKVYNAQKLAEVAFRWIGLNKGTLMLAGGMARWLIDKGPASWTPSDADLFWCAPTGDTVHVPRIAYEGCDYYPTLSEHTNSEINFDAEDGPHVVNIQYAFGRIQLVLCAFKSPAAVLDSFDLSVCMVGYTAKGNVLMGGDYSSTTLSYWLVGDITSNPEYTDLHLAQHVSSQNDKTMKRLSKYQRRLKKGDTSVPTLGPFIRTTVSPFFHIYFDSD